MRVIGSEVTCRDTEQYGGERDPGGVGKGAIYCARTTDLSSKQRIYLSVLDPDTWQGFGEGASCLSQPLGDPALFVTASPSVSYKTLSVGWGPLCLQHDLNVICTFITSERTHQF